MRNVVDAGVDASMEPTEQPYRAARGVILQRNLVPLVLALLPLLLIPLELQLGLAIFGGEGPWMAVVSVSICVSWVALGFIWSMNAWAHRRQGALEVERRGVFLDGELVVPAEAIASATVARAGWTKPVVRLRLRGALRSLELPIDEPAKGEAIIAALRLDAAHARSSYVLPWRLFRWGTGLTFYLYLWLAAVVALMAGLLASRGHHGDLTPLGTAITLTVGAIEIVGYWWLWWRSRLEVTFGTDGLWLRQWGKPRLLGWDEVSEIEPWRGPLVRGGRAMSEGFDLVLRSGERVGFYTARERMRRGLTEGDVVADRLRATMEAATRQARSMRVALPPKRGRVTERWIEDLRRAGTGQDSGLRQAAVDPDQLWHVVEDAALPPRERAAAATALSGAKDRGTRARLRAAAAAVALPPLRAAMEAAAEEDDERLVRALEEVEAHDSER